MNCTLPIMLVFNHVGRINNRELTIIVGFCSYSFVNIPHAQTLQQDPSAFWRDRIIYCPCALTTRVDTIWYTVSSTKSVHFSASLVESPSRCASGRFSSTIVINSNAFRCSTHKFQTCLLYNSCISMHRNVFTLKIPSHTSVAVAGSMLNDRLTNHNRL